MGKNLVSYISKKNCELIEVDEFFSWAKSLEDDRIYGYESVSLDAASCANTIVRTTGEMFSQINIANYNYLGISSHPSVLNAAKKALYKYGLGACSSPLIGGGLMIHKQLEQRLIDFFGSSKKGVSLFTTGFNVNLGVIDAMMRKGTYIILDEYCHVSIIEGARLSGAEVLFFRHNDMSHLRSILEDLTAKKVRKLICSEGIFSADGNFGNIEQIVKLAKQYRAMTLIDEAHSILVCGQQGKGVSHNQGVLFEVDFLVITFSKALGGLGGAVITCEKNARYINYYAKCRMFSCALDPAMSGGVIQSLQLASGEYGDIQRERLQANTRYMRKSLSKSGIKVLGNSDSWIIPILYYDENITNEVNDYLQRQGIYCGLMMFPSVPRKQARIRLFITSKHTKQQMDKVADVLISAAKKFNFKCEDL